MSTTNRTAARSQDGFTLVEALIAMVVLSFGLIAVTNLMLVAATSNGVANQSSAATSIASQHLELLKACTFTDPRLNPGGDLQSDVANFNEDTDVPGVGRIHTRWQITDVDATTKYIVVRSEGTGALAGPRSRAQFTTLRVQQPTS